MGAIGIKKIGLPQGLYYWQDKNIWEEFFARLGLAVITSGPSSFKIISQGAKLSENEACFSYKVFLGHVLALFGKVDAIFIPTYLSSAKNFISCPKFSGISHVLRCLNLPQTPLVFSPIIDLNKTPFLPTLIKIGKDLGRNASESEKAARLVLSSLRRQEENDKELFNQLMKKKKKKILLFSHRYILEDKFVNFRIADKLENMGLVPIPIWLIPLKNYDEEFGWDFVAEELGKLKSLEIKKFSGIIQLSSFNCGPDSVITEYLYEFTKKNRLPFLSLLLDEHTGEAGITTRLEAFFDTINFSFRRI